VYPEWKGWCDFLGTNNVFLGGMKKDLSENYVLFWDACRVIQKLAGEHGWQSAREYHQAYRDGLLPKGIPSRPDMFPGYANDWQGWDVWLGKSLNSKVVRLQEVKGVFAAVVSAGMPPNVIEFMLAPEGVAQMREMLDNGPSKRVVKAFIWEVELGKSVWEIINACGSDQGDGTWIVSNVNNLVFEIGSILEFYR
jgi:hypothetical protein